MRGQQGLKILKRLAVQPAGERIIVQSQQILRHGIQFVRERLRIAEPLHCALKQGG